MNDSESPSKSLVGTMLSDRYRVEKLLGEGGMGAVYLGEHTLMRKRVAIKVLHPEMTEIEEVVKRFEREARVSAGINHPNVVVATDFGRMPDGGFFLVLEFIEGKSLRDVLHEQGPMSVERALRITRQILDALAAAHSLQVVHRDLKPENVMLVEKNGNPDFVKILDFGIAKESGARVGGGTQTVAGKPLTQMGVMYGTPEYMAPEQALGQVVDWRADLYTVGVMLFEMLSGTRPFDAPDMVQLVMQIITSPPPPVSSRVAVPPEVDALINALLEKTTDRRPQSAHEVVAALDGILARYGFAGANASGAYAASSGSPGSPSPGSVVVPAAPVIGGSLAGGYPGQAAGPTGVVAVAPVMSGAGVLSMPGGAMSGGANPGGAMSGGPVSMSGGGGNPSAAVPSMGGPPGGEAYPSVIRPPGSDAYAATSFGAGVASTLPTAIAQVSPASVIVPSREDPLEKLVAPVRGKLPQPLRDLPAIVLLGGAAGVVVIPFLLLVVVIALSGGDPKPLAAGSASASASAPPPELAFATEREIETARKEGPAAVAALADKHPSDPGVWRALMREQLEHKQGVAALSALKKLLTLAPKAIGDDICRDVLLAAAKESDEGADATISLLEATPGPEAVDALYELSQVKEPKPVIVPRAQKSLAKPEVKDRASPALKALTTLKAAKGCEASYAALSEVKENGDARALPALKLLTNRTGCSTLFRTGDCFPCLRKDKLLDEAMAAAERRK